MRKFKRDNWTNDQVLMFIDGQKIVRGDGTECDYCKSHNMIIDDIKSFVTEKESRTNEEVFALLDGLRLVFNEGETISDMATKYNNAIDDVADYFYDFTRPVEEFGAMGYFEEEGAVFHIGKIPE